MISATSILAERKQTVFSFFFQAEDGIRDGTVTGVQTCALPISGLPAQLLARRPDVAEAEQNVVAANAQIGVATAEFFPRFMLTATAGLESADLSALFTWQSRAASILPSVSIPIFQGGRLRANLEAIKAFYRQTVAAYVNQVLIAYGDVEDALTDLAAFSDEVGSLREAVSASRNYLRLAQSQYKYGLVDYLIVVDAERTLLANQLSLAQAVNSHGHQHP